MTIITYEIDSTPRGIIQRLERKNNKNQLAMALQQIRTIRYNDTLSHDQKIKPKAPLPRTGEGRGGGRQPMDKRWRPARCVLKPLFKFPSTASR